MVVNYKPKWRIQNVPSDTQDRAYSSGPGFLIFPDLLSLTDGTKWLFFAGVEEHLQVSPGPSGPSIAVDGELLELRRGNLLLEREKLSLEIQILRLKMAKLQKGEV